MNRRRIALRALLASAGFALGVRAYAQARGKRWRIGVLLPGSSSAGPLKAFQQAMRDLGYVEGTNLAIEWRFAEGQYERLPKLASELAQAKVDAILADTTLSVQAARQAMPGTPIVMVAVPDPVGEGFISRLARPGGNITGLSNIVTEVSAKHVELLSAIAPKLSRVAVLANPHNPSDALILEQIQGAAYPRGVKVLAVEAGTAAQIEIAFAAMREARSEALIVSADPYFQMQREQIARLAIAHRIPAISSSRELTQAGGLMSYGQDVAEHYRRAASYVDRILKGSKPATLPVEQPTVLQFVINRGTAKSLGLTLPQELVLRANQLIE